LSGDSHPVRRAERVAVISLPDEIDVTNSGQVQAMLLQAVQDGAAVLVADMTGTVFCASDGVQALVSAHSAAAAAGVRLRLAVGAGSPAVRRVLALTGADRLLDVYPDPDAALAGEPTDICGIASLPRPAR
jgi:anti-anti-sigma factor